jgi:hypothetical protein
MFTRSGITLYKVIKILYKVRAIHAKVSHDLAATLIRFFLNSRVDCFFFTSSFVNDGRRNSPNIAGEEKSQRID